MYVDVIVVGSGVPAMLAATLFARRGYRTMVVARHDRADDFDHVLVQAEVAATVKAVSPPDDAVVLVSMGLEPWGAREGKTVSVRPLPYLLLDAARYSRYLQALAAPTRCFKVLEGYVAESLQVKGSVVRGVVLDGGKTLGARLVVDCGAPACAPLTSDDLPWFFPDTSRMWGATVQDSRKVGQAASAWKLGTCTFQFLPPKGVAWTLRYSPDSVLVGAASLPGRGFNVLAHVRRFFDEAGILHAPERLQAPPSFCGPPIPVPMAPGYLAAAYAAGQANPVAPADISAALGGVFLAHAAATRAIEDGDVTQSALWAYPRAFARQWGGAQAYAATLLTHLLAVDPATFDRMLGPGMLDEYALSCLFRNKPIDEETSNRVTSLLKSVTRLKGFSAWRKGVAAAREVASLYAQVPDQWNLDAAYAWQQRIGEAFTPAPR